MALVVEYNARVRELVGGWQRPVAAPDTLMDAPPVDALCRTPPTLREHGTFSLQGRTIVRVRRHLGSYSLGTANWLGLELDNGQVLLYTAWDGARHISGLPRDADRQRYTIESIHLTEEAVRIACRPHNLCIKACRLDDVDLWQALSNGRPMGDLWHVCHADSVYWVRS